jgi:hypothetical protein
MVRQIGDAVFALEIKQLKKGEDILRIDDLLAIVTRI